MHKSSSGFTLMEMLVVVAIVGILIAIAIPMFTGALDKTKETVCAANIRAVTGEYTANLLLNYDNDHMGLMTVAMENCGYTGADGTYSGACPSGGTYTVELDSTSGAVTKITCSKHGGIRVSTGAEGINYLKVAYEKWVETVDKANSTRPCFDSEADGAGGTTAIKGLLDAANVSMPDNAIWRIYREKDNSGNFTGNYAIYWVEDADDKLTQEAFDRNQTVKITSGTSQVKVINGVVTTVENPTILIKKNYNNETKTSYWAITNGNSDTFK